MTGFQAQQTYAPPAPLFRTASPSATHGMIRVAAMAAHHARQARQKLAQRANPQGPTYPVSPTASLSPLSGSGNDSEARAPSPVNSSHTHAVKHAFHVKKNLHLQLNMDVVKKPELSLMVTMAPSAPMPHHHVRFADPTPSDVHEIESHFEASSPASDRRRRASSVTLSMSSPEGAEFAEVAHDGPTLLGTRTKRVKKLGRGAGGTVFLAVYLPTLKLVAVKEVVVYKEEDRRMVKHELHALHDNLAPLDADNGNRERGFLPSSPTAYTQTSPSPFRVAFYGAFLTPARCAVSIVMEFMDMGSLQDLLDARVTVPEPVIRHGAFCCLTALAHMHSHRCVHPVR